MSSIIEQLEAEQMAAVAEKRQLPEFTHGDTVKVWVRITEGTKERLQAYEGIVIAFNGGGVMESFTVRKISYGEGVERVFPLYSPNVASVEVLKRGKVRRAKLYYLRDRRGKSARIFESTNSRTKKIEATERTAAVAQQLQRPPNRPPRPRLKPPAPSQRPNNLASASRSHRSAHDPSPAPYGAGLFRAPCHRFT